jgi:hypothetical protein
MNPLKLAVVAIFILAIGFSASSAKADGGSVVGEYDVSGLLTITGTNSCPPAPACAETLAFSFVIADTYDPAAAQPYILSVISSSSTESLGPLGQFSAASGIAGNDGGYCGPGGDCNRIAFFDSDGDEIDLHVPIASGFIPITPVIESADLFECGNGNYATCRQDMFPNGECCMFNFGEVEATVTPVAEPSSFFMLGAGLFALGLMNSRRRSSC